MAFRVFWPIVFLPLAQASYVTDCLQRSDLVGHTWSDAASSLSAAFTGTAGSYSIMVTDATSVLVGSATTSGPDSSCFPLSTPGDYVQFLAGSGCNTINHWQSTTSCVGNPTYTLIAQPSLAAPSDEPSESSSPSSEPTPSFRPAGDAAQSWSDFPSPVSDVPSPVSDVQSPAASMASSVASSSAPSPARTTSPAASGALASSPAQVSPSSNPICAPVTEAIVPGPLEYISGLPQNGLQNLATTVLNQGDGNCPTVTVGTESVHFVQVTPGLSWLVTLLKGYKLKVTGWGVEASNMVGFLLDYTASDDCFTALKVQKPTVPQSHKVAFAINLDRLDSLGQLLNNYSMNVEIDVDVPIVAVYIFHTSTVGKLLQNEEGHWEHVNGKLHLFLNHTSAIVAFTNAGSASSTTTQSSNGGSPSGLYALLALLAIPAVCVVLVVGFLVYRRRTSSMEQPHLNYQYTYEYEYNPHLAPPPTPVQCSAPFMMV